ncbi:hypothetical protein [Dyadobacter psychrophilus]|uniref:Lipoprotein n=1 Tax=Dyadobacter psychrophilus TaxID=651661 RepID=A0A1T5GLH7_9BACT|nr:hypothetical protein [Dyadobacter psychrophilus]SKC09263.1 hypothetical protein SAMN05660293_04089 [Dyadobacter psychrophilus]
MKVLIKCSLLLTIVLTSCNQTGINVPFGPLDGQATDLQEIVMPASPTDCELAKHNSQEHPQLQETKSGNAPLTANQFRVVL